MAKHLAKNGFMRFLAYVLTMDGHIEQLKEDLANARMEFLLIACLDTNARVATIERVIYADLPSARSIVKHHAVLSSPTLALVSLFPAQSFTVSIIRWTIESGQPVTPVGTPSAIIVENLNAVAHLPWSQMRSIIRIFKPRDNKLLESSAIMNLDPGLTSAKVFIRASAQPTAGSRIALKAMHAASHLSRHGIDWVPSTTDVPVDSRGEPILGRYMDLHKRVPENAAAVYQVQMNAITVLYETVPSFSTGEGDEKTTAVRSFLAMALPAMSRNSPVTALAARALSYMLATAIQARGNSGVIPSRDLSRLKLRLHDSDDYLSTVTAAQGKPEPFQQSAWVRIVNLLAKGTDFTRQRVAQSPSVTSASLS